MKSSKDRQDEVYIHYYYEVYIHIYNVYMYTLFWTKEKKVSVQDFKEKKGNSQEYEKS